MNSLDSAYAASFFNGIIASSFANPQNAKAALNARVADLHARGDAQRSALQQGLNPFSPAQGRYSPSGSDPLTESNADLTALERLRRGDAATRGQKAAERPALPFDLLDARPRSFADIAPIRPVLSPADEIAIFGSPDFLSEAFFNNDGPLRAAKLPAGAPTESIANVTYDFDVGEDGELIAAGAQNGSQSPAAKVAALYARNESLMEERFLSNYGLN